MPRKAKEKDVEFNNKIDEKNTAKTTKKTIATKKEIATKKSATAKTTKKRSASSTKTASKKDNKSTKSTQTVETKSATKSKSKKVHPIVEYYDLPFRYNQTVVKILAQTPNIIYIYWDISDEDRKNYEKEYGSNFFEKTRPYLIITNKTKNYTFEVEINDFANSWYLHVNDADCDYQVELGRKFIENSVASAEKTASYYANDYLPITSSNDIEMPNNHILFDKLGKSIFFRNTKTNIVTKKDISSISFMQNIGKVYNIYDLYKEFYKDEFTGDNILGLDFPSSNSSSNTFKEDTYNG